MSWTSAQATKRYLKLNSEGRCRQCGKSLGERLGHTRCIPCEKANRDATRRRSKRLRDNGLCEVCGKEELHTTRVCSYCAKKSSESNKRSNESRRKMVLSAYGNKCSCCGETHYEFLALDHVNGGGFQHIKDYSVRHYLDAIKRDFPPDYRILCHNCNFARGLYGRCPHESEAG